MRVSPSFRDVLDADVAIRYKLWSIDVVTTTTTTTTTSGQFESPKLNSDHIISVCVSAGFVVELPKMRATSGGRQDWAAGKVGEAWVEGRRREGGRKGWVVSYLPSPSTGRSVY
jgi:hypothetical protein